MLHRTDVHPAPTNRALQGAAILRLSPLTVLKPCGGPAPWGRGRRGPRRPAGSPCPLFAPEGKIWHLVQRGRGAPVGGDSRQRESTSPHFQARSPHSRAGGGRASTAAAPCPSLPRRGRAPRAMLTLRYSFSERSSSTSRCSSSGAAGGGSPRLGARPPPVAAGSASPREPRAGGAPRPGLGPERGGSATG